MLNMQKKIRSKKLKKKCAVCNREFEVFEKGKSGHGARLRAKRPWNSLTCSKYCSRRLLIKNKRFI